MELKNATTTCAIEPDVGYRFIRQGDVLLTPVSELPSDVWPAPVNDPIVIARGEGTGHAHAIHGGGAVLYTGDLVQYLVVVSPSGVDLVHDEHATIHLAPGTYERLYQRTWNEVVERAAD